MNIVLVHQVLDGETRYETSAIPLRLSSRDVPALVLARLRVNSSNDDGANENAGERGNCEALRECDEW
jgi:hypothetical protein